MTIGVASSTVGTQLEFITQLLETYVSIRTTQHMNGGIYVAAGAEDLRNGRHVPDDFAVAHFRTRRSILSESHSKKVCTRPDAVSEISVNAACRLNRSTPAECNYGLTPNRASAFDVRVDLRDGRMEVRDHSSTREAYQRDSAVHN